jgi:hypothetical protein
LSSTFLRGDEGWGWSLGRKITSQVLGRGIRRHDAQERVKEVKGESKLQQEKASRKRVRKQRGKGKFFSLF